MNKYRENGIIGSHIFLFKIFIIFILLIILPTLFLGTFFYKKMTKKAENDLFEMNLKTLNLIQKNSDEILGRIENEMWNIALDPQINYVINQEMSLEEKILKIASIKKVIDNKINTFDIIHSIYVYNAIDEKILTNDTYKDIQSYKDNQYIYNIMKNSMNEESKVRIIEDYQNNRSKVLSEVKKIPLNSPNTKGIIVFNIRIDKIKEILDNYVHTDQIQLILMNTKNGLNISSSNGNQELFKNIGIEDLSEDSHMITKNNFLIFKRFSEYKGYIYMAVVPTSYIENNMKPIRNSILSICGMLLVIGIFISLFLSKYLYNPIDELMSAIKKDIKKSNEMANENIKDEIGYLNYAIRQYKSNNRHNKQILRRNKDIIKNYVFTTLFNKEYLYLDDLNENLEFLNINFKHPNYIVLAIGIDKERNKEKETHNYLDRFAVTNIAEEIINSEEMTAIGVNLDRRKICIVINFDENSKEKEGFIELLAYKIINMVDKYLKFEITIGVGKYVTELVDISISLKHSLQALNYNIINGKNEVKNYKEIIMRQDAIYDYSINKIEKILNNIRIGNKVVVNRLVVEMINECKSSNPLSIQNVKYMVVQLGTLVVKDLIDKGIDVNMILGEKFRFFNEVEEKETVNEITVWIIDLLDRISNYIINVNEVHKNPIINETIKYIEEHYSELISLSDIAEELNITPQYLSRKFKEVKKQTLISFINDYRLNNAKELLMTTKLTIAQISDRTGFSNSKYYIKKFKGKYGITPAAYRISLDKK